MYRAGKNNVAADMFTGVYCSAVSSELLSDLHKSLCHPGVTRLLHFVRARNLPYSVDDIRRVTQACKICCEVKPRFFTPLRNIRLLKPQTP